MHRLVLFLAVVGTASPSGALDLTARVDKALGGRALSGAKIAAFVVRAADGQELYSRNADTALAPASNQKILTAVAALEELGPAHRFTTRVHADGGIDAGGGVETLYVRGGGDPALTSEDWWRIAADLRRRGLRQVRGNLVLDDTEFDRQHWNPAWDGVASRAYHSPVGALTANYGSFAVEVEAGPTAGEPLRVNVDPPIPWFTLSNRGRTAARSAKATLDVRRDHNGGHDAVTVSGSLPVGAAPEVIYRAVGDPALYAGEIFRMQLTANGIAVVGTRGVGAVPPSAQELVKHEGKPLSEIVRLLMKYSNNSVAEALVKAMGAAASGGQGTWANGLLAMKQNLAKAGVDLTHAVIVDGSGLSRDNRVSPRSFVSALRHARRSFRYGAEVIAALPIAGVDGTMQRRANGAAGKARAKTGLLNGITGLSGFAQLADGTEVVFSVLTNGYKGGDWEAMDALDQFVTALVGR